MNYPTKGRCLKCDHISCGLWPNTTCRLLLTKRSSLHSSDRQYLAWAWSCNISRNVLSWGYAVPCILYRINIMNMDLKATWCPYCRLHVTLPCHFECFGNGILRQGFPSGHLQIAPRVLCKTTYFKAPCHHIHLYTLYNTQTRRSGLSYWRTWRFCICRTLNPTACMIYNRSAQRGTFINTKW